MPTFDAMLASMQLPCEHGFFPDEYCPMCDCPIQDSKIRKRKKKMNRRVKKFGLADDADGLTAKYFVDRRWRYFGLRWWGCF